LLVVSSTKYTVDYMFCLQHRSFIVGDRWVILKSRIFEQVKLVAAEYQLF